MIKIKEKLLNFANYKFNFSDYVFIGIILTIIASVLIFDIRNTYYKSKYYTNIVHSYIDIEKNSLQTKENFLIINKALNNLEKELGINSILEKSDLTEERIVRYAENNFGGEYPLWKKDFYLDDTISSEKLQKALDFFTDENNIIIYKYSKPGKVSYYYNIDNKTMAYFKRDYPDDQVMTYLMRYSHLVKIIFEKHERQDITPREAVDIIKIIRVSNYLEDKYEKESDKYMRDSDLYLYLYNKYCDYILENPDEFLGGVKSW